VVRPAGAHSTLFGVPEASGPLRRARGAWSDKGDAGTPTAGVLDPPPSRSATERGIGGVVGAGLGLGRRSCAEVQDVPVAATQDLSPVLVVSAVLL